MHSYPPTHCALQGISRGSSGSPFTGRVPFLASPFSSKLANASGRIEFIVVLFMDWAFASGCSPPRLSTTQLPSATDRPVLLSDEDFHTPLLVRTLRRTPRPRSAHSRLRSFFHGPQSYSFFVDIQQLPLFSSWTTTAHLGQGDVTGLELGARFAYNRSYQRALNRVPTIAAKEKRQFDIPYT